MREIAERQFDSVWDALEAEAAEAENRRLRSALMIAITEQVKAKGWTQTVAASHCGLTQPRVNDLMRGRISRFSLDALVNIASALGLQVRLEVSVA